MQVSRQSTGSFPSIRIPSHSGGLPVEVTLLSQLSPGSGDVMIRDAALRQRGHENFVDALDEPSTLLASTDIANGENSAVYSFVVGREGHPFHRHAGHRVFTAISGSSGARLRFSTVATERLQASAQAFIDALRQVDIPPDSLFTVRFGSGTWHQFLPLRRDASHPALFALSCHTDELGGISDPVLAERVIAGQADIPSLTELLPESVADFLRRHPSHAEEVPTTTLSLEAPADSLRSRFCSMVRHHIGRLRERFGTQPLVPGFIARRAHRISVLPALPADSLLARELSASAHHEDSFVCTLRGHGIPSRSASSLLADILEGFLANRPSGVSLLMRLRNTLVRPLRLRTSPLGCPVSSLLSASSPQLFADRFPVLGQSTDHHDRHAQVLLGADDRHLVFRSCVDVRIVGDEICISLSTRVRCNNLFGRFYMAAIARTHRDYIAPAMLAGAVEHLQEKRSPNNLPAVFRLSAELA